MQSVPEPTGKAQPVPDLSGESIMLGFIRKLEEQTGEEADPLGEGAEEQGGLVAIPTVSPGMAGDTKEGVSEKPKCAPTAEKYGWIKKSSGGLLGLWKDRYIQLRKTQLVVYEDEARRMKSAGLVLPGCKGGFVLSQALFSGLEAASARTEFAPEVRNYSGLCVQQGQT
ncbi:hypothetical protein IHE44_0002867 [Lamprotornis superbus]|uniref:PH domain-containing protein n=1 Tax=Lamprotornis superbus TaxID=245042 RepID=A0A835U0R1_9PASS|nr:hypothetical protein IHE44_0002867 [Lamprotornis superbus]